MNETIGVSLQQVCQDNESLAEWWRTSPRFEHLDLEGAALVYRIPLGWSGWVAVIGHPDHGSYEWIGRHDGDFDGDRAARFQQSDQGYGSAAAALRDGLVAMVD